MKKNPLLIGFVTTLIIAGILRLFVFDVISVSNDSLQPDFFPGDFLLVSKLSSPAEGEWALVRDYPKQSVYSVRKLIEKQNTYAQGWIILDPTLPDSAEPTEKKALISNKKIAGKAVMILWSLPCKPSASDNGVCPDKAFRFFKLVH